jgi:hypothetical protein
MTLANDSIAVTPGVGATVATHTVGGKEHQVMMLADGTGHIFGATPIFSYLLPSQVHVNTANTVHWDLFNADASAVVRIFSILQVPNITTAVTGVVFDWLLERTTSAGTGGVALTAFQEDLAQSALPAGITARSKPTGGAAASTDLRFYALSSEETNAATIQIASQGGLELVPRDTSYVLRQNQGIRVVQVTASVAGNTGWLINFYVE